MKNVMIVEDDKAYALILSNELKKRKYRIKVSHNGSDCLTALTVFQPQYVLLDYFLPDMDGGDLYGQIKQKFPNTRVIILSANDSPENVLRLIKLGIRDYVVKNNEAIEQILQILEEE